MRVAPGWLFPVSEDCAAVGVAFVGAVGLAGGSRAFVEAFGGLLARVVVVMVVGGAPKVTFGLVEGEASGWAYRQSLAR